MQLTSTQGALPAIDGSAKAHHVTHEIAALADFYRALNTRDLHLMAQVWSTTDEVSMANPLGGIVRGWDEIRAFYARMFRNLRLEVAFRDYTIHIVGSVFYAVGRECGHIESDEYRVDLDVRTTRVFRMEVSRWQQAHHHGSINDPDVLLIYRRGIGLSLDAATRH